MYFPPETKQQNHMLCLTHSSTFSVFVSLLALLPGKLDMRDSPVPMEMDHRTMSTQNGPQSVGFSTQSQLTEVSEMAEGVRGNTVATIPPWYKCTKMIYVRPNPKTGVPSGHWPIPESFFPDGNTSKLV